MKTLRKRLSFVLALILLLALAAPVASADEPNPGSGACLRKMDGNQRLSHILLLLLQRSDSDVRFPEGI